MELNNEVNEWNNPLKDIATRYMENGLFEEYGGCYEVTLTREELMTVVSYMMLGMNKVQQIKKRNGVE